MIRETIVTSLSSAGRVHLAPLGLIAEGDDWIIAPFSPSTTLDNLRAVPFAVANHTDDVRVFAGCLTGRKDWPITGSHQVPVPRLLAALAHWELAVVRVVEHELRPRFHCRIVHCANHGGFAGFNRAQAAVIEAAILVSRKHRLPRDKIDREMSYLEIALTKTAGPVEREAWDWLQQELGRDGAME